MPEAAEAGAGLIVEPQIDPLRMALGDLLSDADLRKTMGERARMLVLERFTWARVAEQMEGVYQHALL